MKSYLVSAASIFVMFMNNVDSLPLVCEGSPSTEDLRRSFSTIRSLVQSQDKQISLRIMESLCLQEIPPSDRCCFLQNILHHYMNKVFNNYVPRDVKHRNSISHIANSFLVLSEELKPCQSRKLCSCSDKTSEKLHIIEQNFNKLDSISAALKALGELDHLLDWMENMY